MYEEYYGLSEKPFSLTPDPKYLFRTETHGNAFELLQYAIRRREGFVVVTGDIGTGKTTLCRALLEKIDRNVFTALVLNPFLSEEDLLKLILQDFGVVSREQVKQGRLNSVSKQELIDTLYDFLLSLLPLRSAAVLIIDEAQNLPLKVLEQLRILSNLETDKEKLLQIILVGQLDLQTVLRSPELRQLDQRVSLRYELRPLTREEMEAYVAHRLAVAGGASTVSFLPPALDRVYRLSGGIPRLINLVCDRALVGASAQHTNKVTKDIVVKAAATLELPRPARAGRFGWPRRRSRVAAGAGMALLTALLVAAVLLGGPFTGLVRAARMGPAPLPAAPKPAVHAFVVPDHAEGKLAALPADKPYTVLVAAFPAEAARRPEAAALARRLAVLGCPAYHAEVDLGPKGRWYRVLAGAYRNVFEARLAERRLRATPDFSTVRVVSTAYATATVRAAAEGGS